MAMGQTVKGEGFPDVVLNPVAQHGIFVLPPLQPTRQVLAGFMHIPAVIEPASLPQAIVISLAGQVIQGKWPLQPGPAPLV